MLIVYSLFRLSRQRLKCAIFRLVSCVVVGSGQNFAGSRQYLWVEIEPQSQVSMACSKFNKFPLSVAGAECTN